MPHIISFFLDHEPPTWAVGLVEVLMPHIISFFLDFGINRHPKLIYCSANASYHFFFLGRNRRSKRRDRL